MGRGDRRADTSTGGYRHGRTALAWVLLVVLVGATLVAFAVRRRAVDGHAERTFDDQIDAITAGIDEELTHNIALLEGFADLADANGDIDREEFLAFAESQSLAAEYPGAFAIVVTETVTPDELGEFAALIDELDAPEGLVLLDPLIGPPDDAYQIVLHAAPFSLRYNAVGADIRGFAPADESLPRSIERGEPTMSPVVRQSTLEQVEKAEGEAVLNVLAIPIYEGDGEPGTVEERLSRAKGGVAMAFYPQVLLDDARGASASEVGVEVFEGDGTDGSAIAAAPYRDEPPEPAHGLLQTETVDVGGQEWTLRFRALEGLDVGDQAEPWLVLVAGLLFSGAVFALVYGLLRGRAHALDVAEEATTSLHAAEELFRTAFENAPIGMMLISAKGAILRVNRSVCALLGRRPEELVGRSIDAAVASEQSITGDERVRRLLTGGLETAPLERRFERPDGRSVLGALSLSLVPGHDGTEPYLVVQVEDVTERHAFEARLAHQATHDPLTGLPNRALFMDRLGMALGRDDHGFRVPAVLFVDLDHFKSVNDSRGHAAGDEVLVTVAERLRRSVRAGDTVARFGGDEFTILCEQIDEAEARVVAERVLDTIAAPITLPEGEVCVGVSVGVARADTLDTTAESLLRRADAAMYAAKQQGRDRILVDRSGDPTPLPPPEHSFPPDDLEPESTDEAKHGQPI